MTSLASIAIHEQELDDDGVPQWDLCRERLAIARLHAVWCELADKTYLAAVRRIDHRSGELTVAYVASDIPFTVHSQIVRLGDSIDDADIAEWRTMATTVIDHPEQRLGVLS